MSGLKQEILNETSKFLETLSSIIIKKITSDLLNSKIKRRSVTIS